MHLNEYKDIPIRFRCCVMRKLDAVSYIVLEAATESTNNKKLFCVQH